MRSEALVYAPSLTLALSFPSNRGPVWLPPPNSRGHVSEVRVRYAPFQSAEVLGEHEWTRKRAGKLLLVEDEHVLRGLIAQFLRVEAFEVIEAADGQEAVDGIAARRPFDVVLLDLNLPIYLRGRCLPADQDRKGPSQQVLICSAAIMDSDIDVLQSLGVERFLTKPYHPLDLLAGIDLADGSVRSGLFEPRPVVTLARPHGSIRTIDSVLPASQTLVK